MLDFNRVHGSQPEKPQTIDTSSSSYYVYIRQNIEPDYLKDEEGKLVLTEDGQYIQIGWVYDEAKIPNPDYQVDETAQIKVDVKSLQEDNKKLQEDNKQLKEDNLTLMLGLADLYEEMSK